MTEPGAAKKRADAQGLAFVLGGVGVAVALAAGLWLGLGSGASEKVAVSAPREGPVLAEAPGQLPVPRGLKGLRFGMTPEEVRAALPGFCDPDDLGLGEGGLGFDDFRSLSELKQILPADPPGPRLGGKTTLGTEAARCLLAFAWQDRLSAMACVLGPYDSREAHQAAERALLTALTAKYGHPQPPKEQGRAYGIENERRFLWQDPGARLELISRYDSMGDYVPGLMRSSRLILKNDSAEHLAEAERLRREAAERAAQEEAARQQAREEEFRRLRDQTVDFGKDL